LFSSIKKLIFEGWTSSVIIGIFLVILEIVKYLKKVEEITGRIGLLRDEIDG